MLSIQEISDRLEIQDLIARYAYAIDDRNWDGLDQVFTPDAIIDYTEVGGQRGRRDEIKAYLADAMSNFSGFQHMAATTELKLDGDKATARTILFNPMLVDENGKQRVFFVGLWYCDKMERTADGWRIVERREQKCWNYNAPDGMMPD